MKIEALAPIPNRLSDSRFGGRRDRGRSPRKSEKPERTERRNGRADLCRMANLVEPLMLLRRQDLFHLRARLVGSRPDLLLQ